MNLVKYIEDKKLHIIGDIHGEYDALITLMTILGYREDGSHPEGFKLVFVGDIIDRGPQSLSSLRKVKELVESGHAYAVLGNHELKILIDDPIDGSGWFYPDMARVQPQYWPHEEIKEDDKKWIIDFLLSLPLAIYNEDVKIVHAQWCEDSIKDLKEKNFSNVLDAYKYYEEIINKKLKEESVYEEFLRAQEKNALAIRNQYVKPDFIQELANYDLIENINCVLNVTSGKQKEILPKDMFFVGGKWRFSDRDLWWNNYNGDTLVVFGHYWRAKSYSEDLVFGYNFTEYTPEDFLGIGKNAFCVDFSVGARFLERNTKVRLGKDTALAAFNLVTKELILETGEVYKVKK